MIYFDNSATTVMKPLVLDSYIKTSQKIIGNPSSLNRLGSQANRLLAQSRQQVADLLGANNEEIFFTSGGTESNNWVIKGTAFEKRDFGKHIIISAVEHPSVRKTCEQLGLLGYQIDFIPVSNEGIVQIDELCRLINKNTILISVMAVNNEVGSIQPIKVISEILEKYPNIHFHVDAVQAIGKVKIENWLTDRVDFVSLSAHKFHGPRGVGILYKKAGKRLAPLMNGGGQESDLRSGTENLPAIVAQSKALRLELTDIDYKIEHLSRLKQYLYEALSQYAKVTFFSNINEEFAPHILCFGLKGVRGEVMVHSFEEKDIYISTTSACSSKKKASSSTLHAMGVADNIANTAIRVSLNQENTIAEIEQFMIIFNQLYKKFSKINS